MADDALDFETVYATFHPKIRRHLTRRVGADEADDLTQTVFLKISGALPNFRGDASLATWIYRIADRAVIDWARSRSPLTVDPSEPDAVVHCERQVDPAPLAERTLIQAEMRTCIRGLVDRLPEGSRNVIRLSEFDGLKDAEIAARLGTSLATVKIRLHRARTRLRQELRTHCHLSRDENNELVCDPKRCR